MVDEGASGFGIGFGFGIERCYAMLRTQFRPCEQVRELRPAVGEPSREQRAARVGDFVETLLQY